MITSLILSMLESVFLTMTGTAFLCLILAVSLGNRDSTKLISKILLSGIATAIFSVLITIGIIGWLLKYRIGQDNNWVFVVAATITGLAMFLGFIDWLAWLLATLSGLCVGMWRERA